MFYVNTRIFFLTILCFNGINFLEASTLKHHHIHFDHSLMKDWSFLQRLTFVIPASLAASIVGTIGEERLNSQEKRSIGQQVKWFGAMLGTLGIGLGAYLFALDKLHKNITRSLKTDIAELGGAFTLTVLIAYIAWKLHFQYKKPTPQETLFS